MGRRREERELEREEISRTIRKLKEGKAIGGIDELSGEIWKYDGREMENWVGWVCNRIWRGRGQPEMWREGIIVPMRGQGR